MPVGGDGEQLVGLGLGQRGRRAVVGDVPRLEHGEVAGVDAGGLLHVDRAGVLPRTEVARGGRRCEDSPGTRVPCRGKSAARRCAAASFSSSCATREPCRASVETVPIGRRRPRRRARRRPRRGAVARSSADGCARSGGGLEHVADPRRVCSIGVRPLSILRRRYDTLQLDDVGLAAEVVLPHPVEDLRLGQHALGLRMK